MNFRAVAEQELRGVGLLVHAHADDADAHLADAPLRPLGEGDLLDCHAHPSISTEETLRKLSLYCVSVR